MSKETEIWEANRMIWLSQEELDQWAEDAGEAVPTIYICQSCYLNPKESEWEIHFDQLLNDLDTDDYIDFLECDQQHENTDDACEFCGHEVTKC